MFIRLLTNRLLSLCIIIMVAMSLTACNKVKEWVPWIDSGEEEPIDYSKLGSWTRYRVLHAQDHGELQVSLLQIDYTREEYYAELTLTQYPIHWERHPTTQAINYRIMRTAPTPPKVETANEFGEIEKLANKAEKYIDEGVTQGDIDGEVMMILEGGGDDDGDSAEE